MSSSIVVGVIPIIVEAVILCWHWDYRDTKIWKLKKARVVLVWVGFRQDSGDLRRPRHMHTSVYDEAWALAEAKK